jgi:hypothetical protein
VAEMEYRPVACRHTYRLIILRKQLEVRERGQLEFLPNYRYFCVLSASMHESFEAAGNNVSVSTSTLDEDGRCNDACKWTA